MITTNALIRQSLLKRKKIQIRIEEGGGKRERKREREKRRHCAQGYFKGRGPGGAFSPVPPLPTCQRGHTTTVRKEGQGWGRRGSVLLKKGSDCAASTESGTVSSCLCEAG